MWRPRDKAGLDPKADTGRFLALFTTQTRFERVEERPFQGRVEVTFLKTALAGAGSIAG